MNWGSSEEYRPEDETKNGDTKHDRHEHVRHLVDEDLYGHLASTGLLNQFDHLRYERVFPYFLDSDLQRSGHDLRTTDDLVPPSFQLRNGLTTNNGFVHIRRAINDFSIGWYDLGRFYRDEGTLFHRLDGDQQFPFFQNDSCLSGLEFQQFLHFFERFVPEPGLHVSSREVNGHDHGPYRSERLHRRRKEEIQKDR